MMINRLLNCPPEGEIAEGWTYARFAAATAALAQQLRTQNISTVALRLDDAARSASALFAAWQAGARVLLPPNDAPSVLQQAAQEGALFISDDAAFAAVLPESAAFWLYDAAREQALPAQPETFRLPADSRVLLKTSGSGGEAKTVVKTLAQMEAEAQVLAATLPESGRQLPVIAGVGTQHLYGLTFRIFATLACGWRMTRRRCLYPENLIAAAAEPCIWLTSPALLNRLGEMRDWPRIRANVRTVISAGGMLPESSAHLLAQHGVPLFDVYGSTETGVTAYRRNSGVWTLFDGVSAQTSDSGLRIQAAWTDGVQQSADAAEINGRELVLHGRCDRIIKFEDKRVSLAQIEQDLLDHEWVADAYCGKHPQRGRISAWIALNSAGVEVWRSQGREAVKQALRRHLAATQDKVALPRYWRFDTALPRNPQAKITAADFQAAFTAAPAAPQWQLQQSDEAAQEYVFSGRVPLDLRYFAGHFAGFPLVPGAVEVQWVMELASRFEWGRKAVVQMENLKYQQFLRPNDAVEVHLRWDAAKGKIHFTVVSGTRVCASGRAVTA